MNFFNKILEIEEKYEVHKLHYGNYFVWPLLKNRLLFDAVFPDNIKAKDKTENNTVVKQPSKKSWNIITGLFTSLQAIIRLNRAVSQLEKSFVQEKKDYLFIDGSNRSYVDKINGKPYSRYLSPYFNEVSQRGGAILLNFTLEEELENKFFPAVYHNISDYYAWCLLKYKLGLKFRKQKTRFNNIAQFNSSLAEVNYPLSVNIENLDFELFEIGVYESIYERIFSKIKPAAIFIECFYGNPNHAGLMLAAHKKNIKVVDVQHGVSFDSMYLGWKKTPEKGYSLLPDHFWTWSTYDLETIEKSRNNSKTLSPLLGGNLWYKKYISGMELSKEDRFLTTLKTSYTKIILIALDHSRPIDEYIVDVIKNSPKDWLYLVRFHPHDYITPGYRESYIRLFSDFENVEYKNTTTSTLYHLLSLVDYNISYFSSVCVEAISFKVPSVIIGGTKIRQFEILETKNCFFYSTDYNEILDVIKNEKVKVQEEIYEYFRLKHEDAIIDKLFQKISDQ